MQLLLVRHAEAVDTVGTIRSDADRHLTARGHATAAKLAGVLKGKVELDAVVTSPFIRAQQTAEPLLVLAPAGTELVLCPQLVPMCHDPEAVVETLTGLGVKNVAVVGHLPDLGAFAAWLIGGGTIEFDRGSAALIHIGASVSQGSGELQWLLSPGWYE